MTPHIANIVNAGRLLVAGVRSGVWIPFLASPMVILNYLQSKLDAGQVMSTFRVQLPIISRF